MLFGSRDVCPPFDLLLLAHTIVTNLLRGVRCTLLPPSSRSNWIQRVKNTLLFSERRPQPFKMRTHLCHWDREGRSEMFLNALFKTQNVPALKTTHFLFGGRKMPFKGKKKKVYPSSFFGGKRRWLNHSGVRTFLPDFL